MDRFVGLDAGGQAGPSGRQLVWELFDMTKDRGALLSREGLALACPISRGRAAGRGPSACFSAGTLPQALNF